MSAESSSPLSPVAAILGRVPSGVYVLTLGDEGRETGMLVSWVMQAGFEPPMITVALRHGRQAADCLADGRPFALNVIGEGQKRLLSHFARGPQPGQPAFDGIAVEHTPRGVPVLLGTVGHLECEAVSHQDSGDHRVFLARVVDGRLFDDKRPMVHVRHNGLHY